MVSGEIVNFSGRVISFRDIILKFLIERKLKLDLKNKFVFFCGPLILKNKIISCGPTTSKRMEYGIPFLFKLGIKGIIGKGVLKKDIFKNNGYYLIAVGGAGTYTARRIKSFKCISLPELGPEACYEIEFENLPLLVAIDKKGRSVF